MHRIYLSGKSAIVIREKYFVSHFWIEQTLNEMNEIRWSLNMQLTTDHTTYTYIQKHIHHPNPDPSHGHASHVSMVHRNERKIENVL